MITVRLIYAKVVIRAVGEYATTVRIVELRVLKTVITVICIGAQFVRTTMASSRVKNAGSMGTVKTVMMM